MPTILEMMKEKGVDEILAAKIALTGASGTGKSYFCGLWPRPTILNCDPNGYHTYYTRPDLFGHVEFIDFSQDNLRFPTGFDKLRAIAMEIANKWIKAGESYERTLVIDSASFLQKLALNKAKYHFDSNDRLKGVKPNEHWERVPDSLDYRVALAYIEEQLLTPLCSVQPLRLIVTSHEFKVYEKIRSAGIIEQGPVKEVLPAVIGQLRERLPTYFDELWFMDAQQDQSKRAGIRRTLHTLPTLSFKTKSRWEGILPHSIEEPDPNEIIKIIKNHFDLNVKPYVETPQTEEKVNA